MKDFTLAAYQGYLEAIKYSYANILRFDEFFLTDPKPESFCLIRHDVDRRPNKALQMAQLENRMGLTATYYFRAKSHVFKPDVIKAIAALGHEIGYHYESLSDAKGDLCLALKDFECHLSRFRKIASIKTISSHGRPLKPYDNRDLWRNSENHHLLGEYGVEGEVYLDIDYCGVAYVNDTGRNWSSNRSVIRDHVKYGVRLDFVNGQELHEYLWENPHPRLVFQIHPERWASHFLEYWMSYTFDMMANGAKHMAKRTILRKGNVQVQCGDSM